MGLKPAGNPAHIVKVGRGGENLIHRSEAIHLHHHFGEALRDGRAYPDAKRLQMGFGKDLQGMGSIGYKAYGGECSFLSIHC